MLRLCENNIKVSECAYTGVDDETYRSECAQHSIFRFCCSRVTWLEKLLSKFSESPPLSKCPTSISFASIPPNQVWSLREPCLRRRRALLIFLRQCLLTRHGRVVVCPRVSQVMILRVVWSTRACGQSQKISSSFPAPAKKKSRVSKTEHCQ